MKNKITKYIITIFGILILSIIYLSVVGLETERFNETQIQLIFDLESAVAIKEKDLK